MTWHDMTWHETRWGQLCGCDVPYLSTDWQYHIHPIQYSTISWHIISYRIISYYVDVHCRYKMTSKNIRWHDMTWHDMRQGEVSYVGVMYLTLAQTDSITYIQYSTVPSHDISYRIISYHIILCRRALQIQDDIKEHKMTWHDMRQGEVSYVGVMYLTLP